MRFTPLIVFNRESAAFPGADRAAQRPFQGPPGPRAADSGWPGARASRRRALLPRAPSLSGRVPPHLPESRRSTRRAAAAAAGRTRARGAGLEPRAPPQLSGRTCAERERQDAGAAPANPSRPRSEVPPPAEPRRAGRAAGRACAGPARGLGQGRSWSESSRVALKCLGP